MGLYNNCFLAAVRGVKNDYEPFLKGCVLKSISQVYLTGKVSKVGYSLSQNVKISFAECNSITKIWMVARFALA